MTEDAERKLIRERAAEWACELQEEDAPERHAAFSAWVKESPRHVEEFLFAATAWRALDGIGPKDAREVEKAIALSLAASDNVVALSRGSVPSEDRRRPRLARLAAGLAALALVGALGWWATSILDKRSTYATEIGEQRTVRLADRSVLYLNTGSRAQVRFSERGREVQLLKGEALFVVAPEPARPFRVVSGTAVIQAVGTQFNVDRRASDTTVSVLEGRVSVTNREMASVPPSSLAAGEQATVGSDGRIVKHSKADIAAATAWRERRLVFRGETLEDITNEVNRYNSRHFRIESEAARERRFAGTFSADDPQALARFLEQYDDLSVETTLDEYIIRAR